MKKLLGRILIALSGATAAFWSVVTVAGMARIAGRQGAETAADPGEPMMLVLRFILWSTLAAVLFALGRRLVDPHRQGRQVLELARSALEEAGGGAGEELRTDRVSELYGELGLRDLVRIQSAMDRGAYGDRHRVLLERIRRRVGEDAPPAAGD